MTRTISLADTTLELVERGQGPPLLFLHAGEGLAPEGPWLELLSQRFSVIAPWHPGYGNSPLIDGSGSVDDLAYLYLDLAAELRFGNAVLVGAQPHFAHVYRCVVLHSVREQSRRRRTTVKRTRPRASHKRSRSR